MQPNHSLKRTALTGRRLTQTSQDMPSVALTSSIHGSVFDADPVRLGPVPPGVDPDPPDRFVCLREADDLLLRIDVYAQSDEAHCFEGAEAWMDFVVIGIGERLYLVHATTRQVIEHRLGSYFGHLYPSHSSLYVTSAEQAFSIGQDGKLLWVSETLGIDGVLIHEINANAIRGEGEWDPPGGWRPFAISSNTGTPFLAMQPS